MPNPGTCSFDMMSLSPHCGVGWMTFQTNDTATPLDAEVVDEDGLSTGSIVRNGVGNFTVTLDKRWRKIIVLNVELLDATAGNKARVTSITEGYAAANTLTVETEFDDDVPANVETDDKVIQLALLLVR